MRSFRRLSWAQPPSPPINQNNHDDDDSSSTSKNIKEESRRHRRHRSRREKKYSPNPLGGFIPISTPTTAVTKSGHPAFPGDRPTKVSRSGSSSSRSSDSSEGSEGGISITGPESRSSGTSASRRPKKAGSSSAPPSATQSVPISVRPRSITHSSVPIIRTTPPTPSPLSQAKRAATQPVPTVSSSIKPLNIVKQTGAPYPETPPAMEQPRRDSYVAYHPAPPVSEIHPALRAGSPNPPSPPSSSSPTMQSPYRPASMHGPLLPPTPTSPKSFQLPSPFPPPSTQYSTAFHIQTSPVTPASPYVQHRAPNRSKSTKEDPYDFLRLFDTVFVVDDSLSMSTENRWGLTANALCRFTDIATRYDADGIDIHFLNSPIIGRNVTSSAAVLALFNRVEPALGTPIGTALDRILRPYIAQYEAIAAGEAAKPLEKRQPNLKPLNVVVITDGEATDDPESVIVDVARRLEKANAPLHQIGIQFVQIGDEEGARDALADLDDALSGTYGIRDMVDTTQYEESGEGIVTAEVLLKALLGGVNRRWDRKRR